MKKPMYLGYGLYASYNGFQARIYTSRAGGTHEVFLDSDTFIALLKFIEKNYNLDKVIHPRKGKEE